MPSTLFPTAVELLSQLHSQGVSLAPDGSDLRVWPRASLSWADRAAIRHWKSELLAMLNAMDSTSQSAQPKTDPTPAMEQNRDKRPAQVQIQCGSVSVSSRERSPRLCGSLIAITTATASVNDHEIPPLTFLIASDGQQHLVIHPDDLGGFLIAHLDSEFVCFDAGRVFWIVHKHLTLRAEAEALQVWLKVVHSHRLHDIMLLDILLRLAAGEAEEGNDDDKRLEPHRLPEIAITYGIQNPNAAVETPPIGMSFGTNYSVAGPAGDQRLSTEAARLLSAYRVMHARAVEIMTRHGFQPDTTGCFVIAEDAIQRFGVLTEAIQVEAAIALAQVQRNGLHTSAERLRAAIEANHRELTALVARLHAEYPSLLKFDSSGNLQRTPTRLPSYSATELEFQLVRMADEIGRQTRSVIEIPRGKKGGISRSQEAWEHLAEHHPFAELWFAFEKAGKQSQFLAALNQPVIHPEYRILVRTGRTSCRNPNMQQIPRGDAFRETIIASPGYLLLALDYAFIELVTLAAICKTRFGFSRLGDVISEGIDPYCFAAAALLNLALSEFMALRDSDELRFKQLRQHAKPIVLGVPVGLGPASLVKIACKQYGVVLTLAQATDFRRRLIEEIYPELSLYRVKSEDIVFLRGFRTE